MFHRTEGGSSEPGIFEGDKCWYAILVWMAGVGGVGGVAEVISSFTNVFVTGFKQAQNEKSLSPNLL
jgi:hypothetical protein